MNTNSLLHAVRIFKNKKKTKLHGFSPQANYTDRLNTVINFAYTSYVYISLFKTFFHNNTAFIFTATRHETKVGIEKVMLDELN
jgi:hypothetical protein